MFGSCSKVFYTITVFWILLWVNFCFGMISIGIISLVWGLTTDHWKLADTNLAIDNK